MSYIELSSINLELKFNPLLLLNTLLLPWTQYIFVTVGVSRRGTAKVIKQTFQFEKGQNILIKNDDKSFRLVKRLAYQSVQLYKKSFWLVSDPEKLLTFNFYSFRPRSRWERRIVAVNNFKKPHSKELDTTTTKCEFPILCQNVQYIFKISFYPREKIFKVWFYDENIVFDQRLGFPFRFPHLFYRSLKIIPASSDAVLSEDGKNCIGAL